MFNSRSKEMLNRSRAVESCYPPSCQGANPTEPANFAKSSYEYSECNAYHSVDTHGKDCLVLQLVKSQLTWPLQLFKNLYRAVADADDSIQTNLATLVGRIQPCCGYGGSSLGHVFGTSLQQEYVIIHGMRYNIHLLLTFPSDTKWRPCG